MTYILGARCDKGVVLVADRRISIEEGSDYEYGDKITTDLENIIIGYSGSRPIVESIRNAIIDYRNSYRSNMREEASIHKILSEIEQICYRKNDSYKFHESFDLLVAISSKRLNAPSRLIYFYQDGRPEGVNRFKAIGRGSSHGNIFLKKYGENGQNITMEEAAELGHFIIRYIEAFRLDLGVGLDNKPPYNRPQIWFVPDDSESTEISEVLLGKFETNNKTRLEKISKNISELWSEN